MKKILLPSMLLMASVAFAQTYSIYIQLKSGEQLQYNLAEIEQVTFVSDQTPAAQPVSVKVPSSFQSSYVQKVMYNGKQIAEIDLEYVKALKKQMVVAYPCDENGKADLSKGLSSTGAAVAWDVETNTATVGEEGEACTAFYIVDGEVMASYDGETAEASLVADVINDKRGEFDNNTYRIVKVGTQYWMADNLRATCFRDGTSIESISSGDGAAWKANTTGAYLASTDYDWLQIAGYLYNGYTVTNEKGIAPEGWEVPTREQLVALRSAGSLLNANFKDSAPGTWGEGMTGDNLTGFSAVATGSYTGSDITSPYADAYFWSSSVAVNWLKKEGLDTFRVNGTAKNTVVSNADPHEYAFGHSIRCIRK